LVVLECRRVVHRYATEVFSPEVIWGSKALISYESVVAFLASENFLVLEAMSDWVVELGLLVRRKLLLAVGI